MKQMSLVRRQCQVMRKQEQEHAARQGSGGLSQRTHTLLFLKKCMNVNMQ